MRARCVCLVRIVAQCPNPHPPAVLRLKADNEALRCQLAYLKTLTSQSLQQQRSNELMEVFLKLQAEQPSRQCSCSLLF